MSAKVKFVTTILVIFFVIGGLFIIGKTGFSILSGLRAYVGGEGLWAKGQKDATYYISQYIITKEQASYQSFLNSLKVPLGDNVARLELEKAVPD
jgi:two-component system, sensor histidine kinase